MPRKGLLLAAAIAAICSSLGCAGAGSGKLVKVERFSPPLSVKVKALSRALEVSWRPSPDAEEDWFEGYNVYYSKESLLLKGGDQLPTPIMVGKDKLSVTIEGLDPGVAYFVHVRGRRKGGELSLPSLPEVVGIPNP